MKKTGKSTFFIVVIFIALFAVSSIFGVDKLFADKRTTLIKGVDDIRLGIDIKGGVDVTFSPEEGYDATEAQLDAATEVIKTRLSSLGITDNEVYSDEKSDRIIVRFPWQVGETDFDPEALAQTVKAVQSVNKNMIFSTGNRKIRRHVPEINPGFGM